MYYEFVLWYPVFLECECSFYQSKLAFVPLLAVFVVVCKARTQGRKKA
jgi:hypothetical protein